MALALCPRIRRGRSRSGDRGRSRGRKATEEGRRIGEERVVTGAGLFYLSRLTSTTRCAFVIPESYRMLRKRYTDAKMLEVCSRICAFLIGLSNLNIPVVGVEWDGGGCVENGFYCPGWFISLIEILIVNAR